MYEHPNVEIFWGPTVVMIKSIFESFMDKKFAAQELHIRNLRFLDHPHITEEVSTRESTK